MKLGIYADPHITKNMRDLQSIWERSATDSILNMYKKFDKEEVDFVVCLGDLFDKPVIEAKSLHLVLPILNIMNSKSYPTYILLGNHEIDDNEHNILEYLSEYENIKPVTNWDIIREEFTFIPYNVDILSLDPEVFKDRYVFTHHDIYGSALAGGKTSAFFGVDPTLLKEAKFVFNGHVHLRSQVTDNVMNVGSLLVSMQGELVAGQLPQYYILDSESGKLDSYENSESMIYLTVDSTDIDNVISLGYDKSKMILKVDYEGEIPSIDKDIRSVSWRKKIVSIDSENKEIISTSNFDFKEYLLEYIKRDTTVKEEYKESYMKTAMEVLN